MDRPILFSGAMVCALLAGTKTQTRRAMKPQPSPEWEPYGHCGEVHKLVDGEPDPDRVIGWGPCNQDGDEAYPCPYGRPGDKLWVRETCLAETVFGETFPCGVDGVHYLADGAFRAIENTADAAAKWLDLAWYGKRPRLASEAKTVPSIHMPRWASRITLEITNIRVERLQDISEADALAEGVGHDKPPASAYWRDRDDFAMAEYSGLWEAINGQGSWDTNPWVWVIEFGRLP